jgi:hypothetical protein
MTHKEKAIELVDKYTELFDLPDIGGYSELGKQCSLIVCNEMIKEHEQDAHDDDRWEYWIKVKQEL